MQKQNDTPKLNWKKLRKLVWERDCGICQVCGAKIKPSTYHCGHIVDRCIGGPDEPGNLLVMCEFCNQVKPIHETREEFDDWMRGGYWRPKLFKFLMSM